MLNGDGKKTCFFTPIDYGDLLGGLQENWEG